MKKFYLLVLFSWLLSYESKALMPLPNGSTAPDWTMTDINGVSHHLYDYLNAGKTVFLDFSATWCGPCWNYHNSHALKDLYEQYGPGGTNEVMVIFIEADGSTSRDCLYGLSTCVGGTQGNWVAGTPYPIIDDASQDGAYNITYFPTIYGICPGKKIYELGQVPTSQLYEFVGTCRNVSYATSSTNIPCYGQTNGSIDLEVTGGIPPFTYQWSNGATTEDISNLAPGSYRCTITGQFGYQAITNNVNISQPTSSLSGSTSGIAAENCEGGNGRATITGAGGTAPYTYLWSNGSTGSNLQYATSGDYTCTITDAHGCTFQQSATVPRVEPPRATADYTGIITCNAPQLTLNGDGSSSGPPYSVQWTTTTGHIVSGGNSLHCVVDAGGDYFIRITDTQHGCYETFSLFVASDNEKPHVDAGPPSSINCGQTSISLDGTASSTGPQYSPHWTTSDGQIISGQNSLTPVVGSAGTYVLTIINTSNGCSRGSSVLVSQSSDIVVGSQLTPVSCFGEQDGSATVNPTGGTGAYTYRWSNGATTQSISALLAGSYTVTVTDASNCFSTKTVEVTQPVLLKPNAVGTDASGPGIHDGSAIVVPSGGTTPYTVVWSNGETTPSISGLAPGNYSVTVTDAHGCEAVQSVSIANPGCTLSGQIVSTVPVTCFGGTNGSAMLNALNNEGLVEFTWPDGTTGAEKTGLPAGTYEVELLDVNGCPATLLVTITQPEIISHNVLSRTSVVCLNDDNGAATIEAKGGSESGFTYAWDNGQTGPSATDLTGGLHRVTITDDKGCSFENTVEILSSDNVAPVAVAKNIVVPVDENGIAHIDASLIDNGSTDNCGIDKFTVSPSEFTCDFVGQRTVIFTVYDQNGNSNQANAIVNIVDVTAPQLTCPANVEAHNCDQVVNYGKAIVLDNCSTGEAALSKGLDSGSKFPFGTTEIEYTYTDASGNVGTCSFNVILQNNLASTPDITNLKCHNEGKGQIDISNASGGVGPYTFKWENGSTDPLLKDLDVGVYKFTVYDASGCEYVGSAEVVNPDIIDLEVVDITGDNGTGIGKIDINVTGGFAPYTYEWKKDGKIVSTDEDPENLASGSYEVVVTDAGGCTFGPYKVNVLIGTDNTFKKGTLTMYPNPAGYAVYIQATDIDESVNVDIYDVTGRKLYTKQNAISGNGNFSINLDKLPDGLYNVHFYNEKASVNQKLVISRR